MRFAWAGGLACCAVYCGSCLALDVEPGGYTAGPPTTTALSLAWHHVERDAAYRNGQRLPGTPHLDTDAARLVLMHYRQLGDLTVAPTLIANCSRSEAGGTAAFLGNVQGCADPVLGAIFWAINQPAQQRYLGISPYVVVPVGAYDAARPLNPGEHRWKLGVNAGYITAPGKNLLLDVIGDVLWHGDNDQFGPARLTQQQAVIYNAQLHVRYLLAPGARLSFSYLHDWGGETTVAGIAAHDRKNQGRYRVGGALALNTSQQLQLEVGADTRVANGYKESRRSILRYVARF